MQRLARSGTGALASLDDLKHAIEAKRRKQEDLFSERETRSEEVTVAQERVASAKAKLADANATVSVMEGKLAQLASFEKQIIALDEKLAAAQKAVREGTNDEPRNLRDLRTIEVKVKNKDRDWKQELDDLRSLAAKAERDLADLSAKRKEIEALRLPQLKADRASLDRRIVEAQKESSTCAKSTAKVVEAIEANKDQIQKSYVISEHIRAWKRRCEAKKLYDAAVETLGAAKEEEEEFQTPLGDLAKALSKKRRQREKIIASTASTEGAVKERTRQLQQQQLELRETKELKHIGKRHKRKLIECETQKFAIADLEKCVAPVSFFCSLLSLFLYVSLSLSLSLILLLPCRRRHYWRCAPSHSFALTPRCPAPTPVLLCRYYRIYSFVVYPCSILLFTHLFFCLFNSFAPVQVLPRAGHRGARVSQNQAGRDQRASSDAVAERVQGARYRQDRDRV